jgi:signal transduction histidine kinase
VTLVSLAFLVVCIFGVFAYGSSSWMAVRQISPVWTGFAQSSRPRPSLDRVSLAMFLTCTVWFLLNATTEFQTLARPERRQGLLDVAVFALAFAFPPLIMHLVYRESSVQGSADRAAWRWPVGAMYAVSPAVGLFLLGGILNLWMRPPSFGRMIGWAFAVLFTLASAYAVALMARRSAGPRSAHHQRMNTAMLWLFSLVTLVFLAIVSLGDDRSTLANAFDRLTRATPILFFSVGVYFENRFEFYDLVIKRGVILVATIAALGAMLMLVQPVLDGLPAGPVRPWLAAVILIPAAMVLPWLSRTLSARLDRAWFGREFTAVEAVKHLLGAMQPATDEQALVRAAEQRLTAVVNTPVRVRLETPVPTPSTGLLVEAVTPSGQPFHFEVPRTAGARWLLSEDLAMLRSLASVFGFMLETLRLQHKRQEQELVTRDLRLQASRSELKALRAQINPHFLFNALNAIASLIHTDPARADAAVEQLAEVFRYTLRRSDSEWAPLDQELALARAYLDVERARFGPRLTAVIESDHGTPAPLIPSMLLQTLIENAVKHGVSQTRGHGRVAVVVRTADDAILIEVRDNGPGPGAGTGLAREGEGFGLRSVRERLAGHFGERAALTLTRDEASGTTIARITMPMARVAA